MLRIFKDSIYILFPKRCPGCDEVIYHMLDYCPQCSESLKPTDKKLCVKCGSPIDDCRCKQHVFRFSGCVAPYINTGTARNAIYGFKFGKNIDAAVPIAREIAGKVTEYFSYVPFDCVTSVPMHSSRKASAAYDHSKVLAKAVAVELGLPYKKLLIKYNQRQTQHELNERERFENVKNSYKACNNSYENVLLIDDIKTTGATLDECARALMSGGTENVYCAAAVNSACKDS